MSTAARVVLFVSLTNPCTVHDITQLRNNFDPQKDWFDKLKVLLDMGYIGFEKDHPNCKGALVPKRKLPRRGKNKNKTDEELFPQSFKDHNTMISKNRVWIEHAIGAIKRFFCLKTKWRNHIPDFQNAAILMAAGIWNLHLGTSFV